jgi:hypothetical protein
MACTCKDFSGSPAEQCLGLCKPIYGFIQSEKTTDSPSYDHQYVNKLADDISKKIDNVLLEAFRTITSQQYKSGFKEGFKEGFKLAKELEEDCC